MSVSTRIVLNGVDNGGTSLFTKLGRNATDAQRKVFGVNSALQDSNKELTKFGQNSKSLGNGLVGLGASLGGVFFALGQIKESLAIKVDFDRIENTLKTVTGSTAEAKKEMSFITSEAERLGLALRPLAQTYARLTASTRALGMTTEDSRTIFTGIAESLTAIGATKEQSIRVFSAIEQMASKGVVSMEELRQQLGESLPSALATGAKAMNMSVEEFIKKVGEGKVASKDFLVPFAKAMQDSLGKGAVTGAKLFQAELNRLQNNSEELRDIFADGFEGRGGFMSGLSETTKTFADVLKDPQLKKNIADLGQLMGTLINFAGKMVSAMASVQNALGTGLALPAIGLLLGGKFAGNKVGSLFGGGSKGGKSSGVGSNLDDAIELANGRLLDSTSNRFINYGKRQKASGRYDEYMPTDFVNGAYNTASVSGRAKLMANVGSMTQSQTQTQQAGFLARTMQSTAIGFQRFNGQVANAGTSLMSSIGKISFSGFANGIANLISPLGVLTVGLLAWHKVITDITEVQKQQIAEDKRGMKLDAEREVVEQYKIERGLDPQRKKDALREQIRQLESDLASPLLGSSVKMTETAFQNREVAMRERITRFQNILAELMIEKPLTDFEKKLIDIERQYGEDKLAVDQEKFADKVRMTFGKLTKAQENYMNNLIKEGENAEQVIARFDAEGLKRRNILAELFAKGQNFLNQNSKLSVFENVKERVASRANAPIQSLSAFQGARAKAFTTGFNGSPEQRTYEVQKNGWKAFNDLSKSVLEHMRIILPFAKAQNENIEKISASINNFNIGLA